MKAATIARRDRRRARLSSAGFVLPLIAIWLLPIIAVIAFSGISRALENGALKPASITTVQIGSRINNSTTAVDVDVALNTAPVAKVGASGIVTALPAAAGSAVSNGVPLVEVNDRPILAFAEPSPLYRQLSMGSSGKDVTHLAEFLGSLNLLSASEKPSTYNRTVAKAVSAFQKRYGYAVDGTFDPAYVVWVPAELHTVHGLMVKLGDAINPGDPVIDGPGAASSINFKASSDGQTPVQLPPEVKMRLTIGGDHIDFVPPAEPADQKVMVAALESGVAGGTVSVTRTEHLLTYKGPTLSLADPPRVGTVPSSALYVSKSGAVCVFVKRASGYSPVAVQSPELLFGELGTDAVSSTTVGQVAARSPRSLPEAVLARCK